VSATPQPADTDRNLLFGVLALQADLLDAPRFAEACAAWAARKDVALADLLLERGWLSSADRASLDHLLQRKLERHQGDARVGLAATLTPEARQALSESDDAVLQQAALTLPPPVPPLPVTVAHQPQSRDRYVLVHLHATGGIGQVWLARDANLGREVALKELRPDRAARVDLGNRFLTEAQVTGQLEHPGIVPIYDLVRPAGAGQPFYTMRFVRGRTLAEAVRAYHRSRGAGRAGAMELRELLDSFVTVCKTVAYAHSRGVIHRDLKPGNIALGDFGEVLVLDWGLAKLLAAPPEPTEEAGPTPAPPVRLEGETPCEVTRTGQVMGTPAFMSPEQAEGRHDLVDTRSDVYSLGAILYEILTGQPPFAGDTNRDVLGQVLHEEPPPPQRLVPAVPRPLAAVCLKALARRPEQRYPSASALADEVRRWLADEPVQAWPEPLPARARRWLGRHRTLVSTAVAALAVAALSLGAATVLLSRANDRERRAHDRARANFVLAREAVDRYCTKVSDDPRLKEKDLEELRRQLLQTAAEFYEKFAEQEESDPELRVELGRAHRRLSGITNTLAGPRAARAPCQRSIDVLEALCAERPGEPADRDELARSYHQLGFLLRNLGELSQAAEAYGRARDIWQALTREQPDRSAYTVNLGGVHANIGLLEHMQGRYQRAIEHHRQASAILEPIHQREPDNDDCLEYLGNSYDNLANTHRHLGQWREAVAACRLALPLRERQVALQPGLPWNQSNLVYDLHVLALIHSDAGEPQKSLQSYARALALAEKLVADHPNVTWYQADLAMLHGNVALVHQTVGKPEKALAEMARALEVYERLVARRPDVPDHQVGLFHQHNNRGMVLMKGNHRAEGFQELREARKVFDRLTRHPRSQRFRRMLVVNWCSLGRMYRLEGQHEQSGAALREGEALLRGLDLDQVPANDLHGIADACTNLALYSSQVGSHARAVSAYRQAIALEKRYAARPPRDLRRGKGEVTSPGVKLSPEATLAALYEPHNLASLYAHLGEALRKLGRHEEAVSAFQQAVSERQALLRAEPNNVNHPAALANDMLNLATLLRQGNQPRKAVEMLGQAADVLDQAGRDASPGRPDEANRARVQGRLGELWSQLRRRPQAVAAYGQARTLYRAVLARHPNDPEHQQHLATVENNLSVLAFLDGKYAEAVTHAGAAITLLDTLLGKHPDNASHRVSLANALVNRGAARDNANQSDEALQDNRRALPLLEKLDLTRHSNATAATMNLTKNSRALSRSLVDQKRFPQAIEAGRCSVVAARLLVAAHPREAAYRDRPTLALAALAAAQAAAGRTDDATRTMRDAETALAGLSEADAAAPAARAEPTAALAHAQLALGKALARAGRLEEALNVDRAALNRLAPFPATDPNVRAELLVVSDLSKQLGDALLAQGKLPRALRAMRARVVAWERLVAAHPERKAGPVALAAARADLGSLLWRFGQFDASREQLDQAIAAVTAALKSDPTDFLTRTVQALALGNRAVVAALTRQPNHALRLFRQAIAVQEKLVAEQPGPSRPGLARLYGNLAKHLLDTDRPAQAAEALQKQVAQLEALPAPVREQPTQQVQRAMAVAKLADALVRAGRVGEAE
jgi:serine/threonine-protein kinase